MDPVLGFSRSTSPENLSEFTTPLGTGNATPARTDSAGFPFPSYLQFTPKRAMASFDNLVALANHQERLKGARKMVWRDRGEPATELYDLRACLEHAARGGLRAGSLAFNIRAALNLVLALIRIQRVPRDLRLKMIRREVLGTDTARFAAMLGTFVSVYKFLLNALPLLLPHYTRRSHSKIKSFTLTHDDDEEAVEDEEGLEVDLEAAARAKKSTMLEVPVSDRRAARLSLSTHASVIMSRKKTKRWHAAFSGFVAGGLAIMWEARSRRSVIGQQMFVRGLQGSYNAYTTKRNIKIPHGDVLVFCLACGQVMYAFLLRPDTIPRSYNNWISQASKVPREAINMHTKLVREGTFDMTDIDKILRRDDISPSNLTSLLTLKSIRSTTPTHPSFPPYSPCAAVHPALSSCLSVPLDRFFAVSMWMLPIYGALHFIPPILFKRKAFMKDPGNMLLKSGLGAVRSSAFLGVFVVIYQTVFCYKHYLFTLLSSPSFPIKLPRWLISALVSKPSFWVTGFLAGLSLLVEEQRRRGELAMYVLPKALESMWVMARGKGLVMRTGEWGEMMLTAIGMGMVMSTYQNDPQHLSGLVRRILYQFVGPN